MRESRVHRHAQTASNLPERFSAHQKERPGVSRGGSGWTAALDCWTIKAAHTLRHVVAYNSELDLVQSDGGLDLPWCLKKSPSFAEVAAPIVPSEHPISSMSCGVIRTAMKAAYAPLDHN